MNAKRTTLLLTVILILIGLTTSLATAQDASKSGKADLPRDAADTNGETALRATGRTESEPNNSFADANSIDVGDVIAGTIGQPGDTDYFRIRVPDNTEYAALIDIDANINGSDLDAVVCLYDRDKTELACNDDAHFLDPLLFQSLEPRDVSPGAPYYVRVREYDHPYSGGEEYTYTLSVYRPMLLSTDRNGVVAGISFKSSDVLAYYRFPDGNAKWMVFFDASDVGITSNVVALAATHGRDDIELALKSSQELVVDGVWQTVTPYDVLSFIPGEWGHYGPETVGEFYFDYRGSRYGLSVSGETIDALAMPWWVSTSGNATFASGVNVRDEDISNLPYGWLLFDGSNVPGLQREDVIAADTNWGEKYWLTILGTGTIDGHFFTQKDIFVVDPITNSVIEHVWHGPDFGFNYSLDAFDLVD